MLRLVVGLLCAAAATPCIAAQGQDTKAQRTAFATRALGINFAFMEAQRAGLPGNDSTSLFPKVWEWKKPAYTSMCRELLETLDPDDREFVDLENFGGYFEAGNAVTATGPMAFTATQRALGAIAFMPLLAVTSPTAGPVEDPATCLRGGYTSYYLKDLYTARSIESTVLKSRADGSDFALLVGVADSTTFSTAAPPSWSSPLKFQQKCYVADMLNPAADVAAQVAAALATSAKVSREQNLDDGGAADRWLKVALRAYNYAKRMAHMYGDLSTCTNSSAASNCKGSGCEAVDEYGEPVKGTCKLYESLKPPRQHLFVAAAALYYATGAPQYRAEADYFWYPDFATYIFNWKNVAAQGLLMMAMAPDMPGAKHSKAYFNAEVQQAAGFWSRCSNDGVLAYKGNPYCKVTPDGSAYPLDFPWGNMGSITNGVCLSVIYQHLHFDDAGSPARARNRCFVQRQLGYIFNHKCSTPGSSCNTRDAEGFSYMVGLGNHYPTKLHSRDVAHPFFNDSTRADGNVLCGALVSGPYAPVDPLKDGPVTDGTDVYTNSRCLWAESEAALDYTAGMICSLMGYAALPDGTFDDPSCRVRTPLTGRVPSGAAGAGLAGTIYEEE